MPKSNLKVEKMLSKLYRFVNVSGDRNRLGKTWDQSLSVNTTRLVVSVIPKFDMVSILAYRHFK